MKNSKVVCAVVLLGLLPFMAQKMYVNSKAKPAEVSKAGDTVDHSAFAKILKNRVDAKGLVDYEGLKKDKAQRKGLRAYLDYLGTFDPEKLKSKKEKLAFWINAYNAAVIAGVVELYPVKSVKDVKDFWHRIVLYVGEKEYSVGEIENSVLRKMDEPRIHWAIVRASKGCASLLQEPYTADKLDKQLEKQEKDYIAGRKQAYVNKEKGWLMLSSLFYWYGEDFVKAAGTKLDYVKKYLSKEDLEYIEDNQISPKYIKYDWSLNEQEKKKEEQEKEEE
jgi:hypothetical protein